MKLTWVELAAIFVMAIAAGAASAWLVLRKLGGAAERREREFDLRVAALDEAVRAFELRLDKENSSAALLSVSMEAAEEPAEAAAPEIQAAIAAAAVAAAGPGARIRSIRSLEPNPGVSPWTQQGRLIVQSSHNLRPQRQVSPTAPEREA